MAKDFRFVKGYRKLMCFGIPLIMVNEIDPVIDKCDGNELVVFDVGANTGSWTKALLQHSDKFIKQIHLFEPLPGNYQTILNRLTIGFFEPNAHKIKLVDKAISDSNKKLTINYDKDVTGYASVVMSENRFGPQLVELKNSMIVDSTSLDNYCEVNRIDRIDLLKIDVEGYEYNVLLGATKLTQSKIVKNVLFEFGTHQLASKHTFKMFWDLFSQCGYSMYQLRVGSGSGKVRIPQYHTIYEDYSKVRMYLASLS